MNADVPFPRLVLRGILAPGCGLSLAINRQR
jgi:hypothetical protein